MIPYNPVQKNRVDHSGGKRGTSDISDANYKEAYTNFSSFGTKKGNGTSGFPFGTTPNQNMIFLTRDRRINFVNIERASPNKGRRKAATTSLTRQRLLPLLSKIRSQKG